MENVPTIKFAPGEVVFKEGDASNSVYLIISGKVEISRMRRNENITLAIQGKNTLFGEMALIDGKPRSATVRALERTFCYKCSAAGILNELKRIDSEVYNLMQQFAGIIRENNDLKLTKNMWQGASTEEGLLYDENVKEPFITREAVVGNKALQDKVEALSPFIKSMYRVLMQIAYG